MNRIVCLLLALGAILLPIPARAGLVVIVNADSGIRQFSRAQIINIFMGRYRKLPNEVEAIPLDIDDSSPERQLFYQQLLGKSLAEVKAYWARLVFSGRTAPPEELASQQAVLERVSRDPAAIGYVERHNLNSKVRAVYELSD